MTMKQVSGLVTARKRFREHELAELADQIGGILRDHASGPHIRNPFTALNQVARCSFLQPTPALPLWGRSPDFEGIAAWLARGFHPGHGAGVDAEALLWQCLPYGLYHDHYSFWEDVRPRAFTIFNRENAPLARITRGAITLCDPLEWCEHDQVRYFASGSGNSAELEKRAHILELIANALDSALPMKPGSQTFKGDFHQLAQSVFKHSYRVGSSPFSRDKVAHL
jgi:hypothetical protein